MFIIPQDVTTAAYEFIFSSNKILRGFGNSLFITVCGTAINLFFTVTMAYALSKTRLRGRNFFLNMVIFSMFFSGGMIPGYIVVANILNMKNTYWSVLLPGAIERPEVTGTGLFPALTRLIYAVDPPNNLCPSLHVICSYYCWRAIYDTEGIPLWYRRFNFVFLLLVCASILYVKQHVIVDIPTAVVASEVPLQLARRFRWERAGYAIEQRITKQKQ